MARASTATPHRRQPSSSSLALLCGALLVALSLFSASVSTPVAGEYSCAPGQDCVGQQLGKYVGPNAESIPCDPIGFAGFVCSSSVTETPFAECPHGMYCPDAATVLPCPSGHWCTKSSSKPTKCYPGSICPEKSSKQRFFTPLLVLIGLMVAMALTFKIGRHRFRQEVARTLANLTAAPSNHAIKVKGLRSAASGGASAAGSAGSFSAHPKINLDFNKVTVVVKGSNDASAAAHATSPASPPTAAMAEAAAAGSAPGVNSTKSSKSSTKTILHSISGTIRGGRLTAIMGPSGSGKTTFLSSLLGKVQLSSGSIQVNHQHSVAEMIAMNIVGFVPQDDVMLPMLTVRDLLMHSALMRLPSDMSHARKVARVDAVMELLGITHIADSVVGDDADRGISGGEKKRCSIGMELVAEPLILALDEPTSGLDSAAAMQVCHGLRSIALQQKVVCCVIHQPRYEIFAAFEDVLLLGKGGHLIYFGPTSQMRRFFARMGFVPPPHTNPADHYLDVISSEDFQRKWAAGGAEGIRAEALANGLVPPEEVHAAEGPDELVMAPVEEGDEAATNNNLNTNANASAAATPDGRPLARSIDSNEVRFHTDVSASKGQGQEEGIELAERTAAQGPAISKSSVEVEEKEMASTSSYLAVPAATTTAVANNAGRLTSRTSHAAIVPHHPASFVSQIQFIFLRCALVDWRDATFIVLDSLLQIIPAVSLSINNLSKDTFSAPLPQAVADTCFAMISQRCQENVLFPAFFTAPPFFYTMIIGVGAMIGGTSTFGRMQSVFHRDRTAGMNLTAYFLAKCLYDLWHLLRMSLIFVSLFYLMSSPRGNWGQWAALILALFWAAQGVSYVVSILVPASRGSNAIAVVLAVCFSVTSGLLPTLRVVEGWGPLRFFWYISYNRWGAEALTILAASDTETDGRMDVALTAVGFNPDNVSIDIGLVFVIGFIWRLIAFFALRRSKPSK